MTDKNEKLYQNLHRRLSDHVERFEAHVKDDTMKFEGLITAQQRNTEAVTKLTASVTSLVDNTSAIVQLHKDFEGAARIGKGVLGFMIWCLKWGAIGTGVTAVLLWLIEYFRN